MPKEKYQLEYPLNTSLNLIWTRISTPGGLAEWFADDVNLQGDTYTFIWGNVQQKAEMIQKKNFRFIRFKWLDDDDEESFFEFRLNQHELSKQLTLSVTDFADSEEYDDAIDLWNSQINELKRGIGLLV